MLQRLLASNDGVPNHLAFNAKEPLIIVGDSKECVSWHCIFHHIHKI